MTTFLPRKVRKFSLPSKEAIRAEFGRTCLMLSGVFIASLGYVIFQVPHNFSAGGVTGIALIAEHFTGIDLGMLFWLMNIPMIILGYFVLDGWKFVGRTLVCSTFFSMCISAMINFLPGTMSAWPVTDNMMLNTIYGGVIGGVGGGMVYRSGSSTGGTGVLALVLQKRTGMPISIAYLIDDGLIIFATGLVFGWDSALFGGIMLIINGVASDFVMEGPSTTRTVSIVTNRPKHVTDALMASLNKGVSYWEIKGGYTDEMRYMINTTIFRNQVNDVQSILADVDPDAFVTIGVSQKVHGTGFIPLRKR